MTSKPVAQLSDVMSRILLMKPWYLYSRPLDISYLLSLVQLQVQNKLKKTPLQVSTQLHRSQPLLLDRMRQEQDPVDLSIGYVL